MSKRGMLDVAVGIEAIPAATMLRVDARCQELFGMDHEQLVGRMSEDLVAVAESGSQAYRDWYQHQHDTLAAAAKDAGPGDDIDVGIGTLVAMTAVTSGETGWEQNLKVATSIGGTRQPDGSVTIGIRTLAEHYPDIAAARMPGPGSKNTEFAYKGVAIFMAGRAGDTVTIDRIVRGPKERSFTNNLTHPDDGRSITIDRWQCKAMAGDMPITYGHAKQTHTDNKDLVDDACAKKAAAELTRD